MDNTVQLEQVVCQFKEAVSEIAAHLRNEEYMQADIVTAAKIVTLPKTLINTIIFIVDKYPVRSDIMLTTPWGTLVIETGLTIMSRGCHYDPTVLGTFIRQSIRRVQSPDWQQA